MAGRTPGRVAARPLLPRGVHPTCRDRRHRLLQQARRLRHLVQGDGRDALHHRRRSQAPRRPHRLHRRAAQLGLGDDPSPARPHHRARRWHFARWATMDLMSARLLPPCPRALAACFAACSWNGSLPFMPPAACSSSAITPASTSPAPSAAYLAPLRKLEWVVYSKRPFGGPEAVLAYLSLYTHRIGHLEQPARHLRRRQCDLQVERLPRQRERADQGDDAHQRRVHPPLPDPRPARRFPSHPPLRPLSPTPDAPTTSHRRVSCSTSRQHTSSTAMPAELMTLNRTRPCTLARAAADR